MQHDSPASAYAHVPSRTWLSDDRIPNIAREQGCKDISQQLFEKREKLNVRFCFIHLERRFRKGIKLELVF